MNYDSMSVHELVVAIANEGEFTGLTAKAHDDFAPLEAALRKAVIREASVGEISIEQHEGYMSPDPMFTVGAKSKLVAGEYWLVKKETP